MRFSFAVILVALGIACATSHKNQIKTQVVTFPDGAVVQINGTNAGRAPASIILPQDKDGNLTGRAIVKAVPNSKQKSLYPQVRVFDPAQRSDRVPDQIVIDMTLLGTNTPHAELASSTQAEPPKKRAKPHYKYIERSKPTQAVGLDRWNPGEY
jgi:hypothetical protein